MGAPQGAAGGVEVVATMVRTRLFGTLAERFRLPIVPGPHEGEARVRWSRSLAFPGLHEGELLSRRTELPPRAALLARKARCWRRDRPPRRGRAPLRWGRRRARSWAKWARSPPNRLQALEAEGVPANAIVGVSGLELAADARLRGTPGGELLAVRSGATGAGATSTGASSAGATSGGRVLARASAHAGSAVRTTISPALQTAAVSALGGTYGGVIAMEPASGQVLGVAGIGLDALQPPGSTFKMITVSGVLEAGIARPTSTLPLRDRGDAGRGAAAQRQRRGMRRHAGGGVRGVVQLGVLTAGREAGRGAAGGDGGTVWLQPSPRDRRRR